MSMEFTLLGTGSSGGVPRIGNDWGECDPDNPRNRRRRCAMLVRRQVGSTADAADATTLLIDAGPDLREQLLFAGVTHLDSVLLTHPHADHIFGFDDLRQLWVRHGERVDVFFDQATKDRLFQAFAYCFEQPPGSSYPPFCNEHRAISGQVFEVEGPGGIIPVLPLQVEHGDICALGVRIGDVAYVPDVKTVDIESSRQQLENLDVLIIDALRRRQHPTHMNVEEALDFIKAFKPGRAILTNMHGDLDYETLRRELPDNIEPGYDGMLINASSPA